TGTSALVFVDLITLVAGRGAVTGITHAHPSAALAAQHDALQQGVALAHGPPALAAAVRAVVIEPLLVAEELLPTDVARMGVVPHDGPVGRRHLARPALDPGRFARQGPRARPGAAVDVGAGVTRVVQDGQDAAVPQRLPEQLAVVGLAPEAVRQEQAVL